MDTDTWDEIIFLGEERVKMNLTEYMSDAIQKIIQDALKASLKNPRESTFLLKYICSQKSAEQKRTSSEQAGVHIPPFLIASITSSCNLFCKGCYARANHSCGEHSEKNELTCREWERIFREAEGLGISFILLAGGEPLIRKDVIEKAAAFQNIIFPIFTNGTMIDDTWVTFFNKNRNLVPIFSIEGNQSQTDDRRGKGIYQTLVKAMDNMNQSGILYGSSVTVTTQNLDTVTSDDFVGALYQKGCKLIFYVEYVPVTDTTNALAPGDIERRILEEKQSMLRQKYTNMIFLSFPGDEKSTGGCLAAGRGFFHINAAGGAEPCPFSPYSDTSLKDGSLIQALQSPLFCRLSKNGMLLSEHDGGCVLFKKEKEVQQLLCE